MHPAVKEKNQLKNSMTKQRANLLLYTQNFIIYYTLKFILEHIYTSVSVYSELFSRPQENNQNRGEA